jgi:hypothetical protein
LYRRETAEQSLEEYAQAVRVYQAIVLELQDASSDDPEVLSVVLRKAVAAQQAVNHYRTAYRNVPQTH